MNTIDKDINCPVCNGKTKRLFNSVQQCSECRHVVDYTSAPDSQGYCDEKLAGTCDYRPTNENDVERMKKRWELVLHHASGAKSLLDYGCANNFFIESAPQDHGFDELVGFDTNWLTGKSDERKLDRYYDVITMWHSMEHLIRPRMVVDRVPHRYLFLIIPWVENMTMENIATTNIFNIGRHLHLYSRKSLFSVLHDYEILEENYEDSQLFNEGENNIVGFALKRRIR